MAVQVFLRRGPFDSKVHTVEADEVGDSLVVAGRAYERAATTRNVDGQDLVVFEYIYEAAS